MSKTFEPTRSVKFLGCVTKTFLCNRSIAFLGRQKLKIPARSGLSRYRDATEEVYGLHTFQPAVDPRILKLLYHRGTGRKLGHNAFCCWYIILVYYLF